MLSSQSQNPYVYCMNNPLRYVDPTGMMGDIPRMSLDEWLGPSYRSASDLLNEMRASQEYFSGLIMEEYHDIIFGSGDYNYQNYDNLNPVLSNRQNPIGAKFSASAPLFIIDTRLLYDSKTNDRDIGIKFNLLGSISTPGLSATIIDINVDTIEEFNTIHDVVAGSLAVPIASGFSILGEKGFYNKDDGDNNLDTLYSGLGLGFSRTPGPGGGIFTNGGITIEWSLKEGLSWKY